MNKLNTNPLYSNYYDTWVLCLNSYDGEKAIKNAGSLYLPMTSGQIIDGSKISKTSEGYIAYEAYKTRAVYPEIYKEAVDSAMGVIFKKSPSIELPKAIEYLLDNASVNNESLESVIKNVVNRQLITGRTGLLLDFQDNNIRFAQYNDISILNWNTRNGKLDFLVLDQSGYVLDDSLKWIYKDEYLILKLDENGNCVSGISNDDDFNVEYNDVLVLGNNINFIPFVFINPDNTLPTPSKPILSGLANSCLTIYRTEADYRQALFMQGQDTLVRIGANSDETVRIGAGARIDVPMNGDAKFIGVNSQGLPEVRQALENDYLRAYQKAMQLFDNKSSPESAQSLRIRVSSKTSDLVAVITTAVSAINYLLKNISQYININPNDINITANLDFVNSDINSQLIVHMMQAKSLGAPISNKTIHDLMVEQGITNKSYDDELKELSTDGLNMEL